MAFRTLPMVQCLARDPESGAVLVIIGIGEAGRDADETAWIPADKMHAVSRAIQTGFRGALVVDAGLIDDIGMRHAALPFDDVPIIGTGRP